MSKGNRETKKPKMVKAPKPTTPAGVVPPVSTGSQERGRKK